MYVYKPIFKKLSWLRVTFFSRYWYVNPSSSWDEYDRDKETGDLVPSHELYPNGLQPTVDHIHSLGLGYGSYGDRGTTTFFRNTVLSTHV